MDSTLADLVVALHLAIVVYMVAGVVLVLVGWPLDWRWIRAPLFRLPHLGIMGYIVFNAIQGGTCILTQWERSLRIAEGQMRPAPGQPGQFWVYDERISFVGRLLRDVLYFEVPQPVLDKVYIAIGVLVVVTLIGAPPRLRTRTRES
jgi:hypothetical protein